MTIILNTVGVAPLSLSLLFLSLGCNCPTVIVTIVLSPVIVDAPALRHVSCDDHLAMKQR